MEPSAVATDIPALAKRARRASRALGPFREPAKNAALERIAVRLESSVAEIVRANEKDLERARAKGIGGAMLDRLMLDEARIVAMARSVREVAALPDPVGETIQETKRPNGLRVRRVRVPLGVIAMIYEARPNVTIEAATLTLKTGNAVLLRGGSEAAESNRMLGELVSRALEESGLPVDAVQIVPPEGHDGIRVLLQCSDDIDLAIPRGGEKLIRFVTEHARVPVVQHYKGVCHAYLDKGADLEEARAIVHDGKLRRPGVCNSLEGLLVERSEIERLLVPIGASLIAAGCEVRGCPETVRAVPGAIAATDSDPGTEFLEKKLLVRVVDGLDDAMQFIASYGSGHSEVIVTPSEENAERFRREVDAACVLVNASSRFHDGGELGLGAELGIATSRLHWRGPMGLEALTTMKWLVDGAGQVRG